MREASNIGNDILSVLKRLKNLDGPDEVSVLMAQILPGLSGPTAAAGFLTIVTPLVFLAI